MSETLDRYPGYRDQIVIGTFNQEIENELKEKYPHLLRGASTGSAAKFVLTQYLGRDEIEEININGWNDIAITYKDGHIEKTKEHFYSPQHAIDIVKRLLHHSGMIIDNATPTAQGHLPGLSHSVLFFSRPYLMSHSFWLRST